MPADDAGGVAGNGYTDTAIFQGAGVVDYEQALAILLRGVARGDSETVASAEADGRVLAADIVSPAALPRFDNAAMDGFALALRGRALAAGHELPVRGAIAAGVPAGEGGDGAWEIMTGAALPAGLDTVVPVERVDAIAGQDAEAPPVGIRLREDSAPGANVRRRGEDIGEGERMMSARERLDSARLMLLAALGVTSVPVVRRPRVALIATGRELVDGDIVDAASIHDSNTPFLRLRLCAAGAEVVMEERVADDPVAFAGALDRVRERGVDLVISTGAVSKGRFDFVPGSLRARGAELLFHGVGIRPGKPLLAARLPEGPLHVGLPGNPASCAVGLRFFVESVLRAMLGLPVERPLRLPLAGPAWRRPGLRTHLHARVTCDARGQLTVHPLPHQESFRLRPFLASQAWLVLPPADGGDGSLAPGEPVTVYPPGHLDALAWTQTA